MAQNQHAKELFRVTGIARDVPVNSHLNFDLVMSLSFAYNQPWFKVWINNNHFVYVLLDKQANRASVEKRFPAFMEKYMAPTMRQTGIHVGLSMTPLKDVYVIEDFNYTSLKENTEPLVISPSPDRRVAVVRLKAGHLQSNVALVKKAYAEAAPAYPFEYSFLDKKFDQLYRKDIRQQTILSIFSGLAIVIDCLGLFGLASFTAEKRTKEIGVRKVLGSSVQNIILLLSKDLLKPVMLATLIAIPVAYSVMNGWLQNFAYRTGLQWWIFALAAGITVVIALATVSFRAVKAAVANPTKSLRNE